MTDSRYFEGVQNQRNFTRHQVLQSFRNAGYALSDSSFYKSFSMMVEEGKLARVGKGLYCFPDNNTKSYNHEYSALAVDVAALIQKQYPLVNFSLMELIQFNDFVNHQESNIKFV